LTHSESDAKEAALKSWKPKFDAEAKYEADEKKKEEEALKDKMDRKKPENLKEQVEDVLLKIRAAALDVVQQIGLLLAKAQEDPVAAVKTYPYAASTLLFTLLTILLSLNMLFSSKPEVVNQPKTQEPKKKIEESDNENKTEVNEEETSEKPTRRSKKSKKDDE
jgi:hypothetical protein